MFATVSSVLVKKRAANWQPFAFCSNRQNRRFLMALFVHGSPCNEEVQQVLCLHLAIAVEVGTDIV